MFFITFSFDYETTMKKRKEKAKKLIENRIKKEIENKMNEIWNDVNKNEIYNKNENQKLISNWKYVNSKKRVQFIWIDDFLFNRFD